MRRQPWRRLSACSGTSQLFRVEESLPEGGITLLEVLDKLNAGTYTAPDFSDFADDVARLNDAWAARDVQAIVGSLDLAYPGAYLLAESWERMRRAFSFVGSLNAGVTTMKIFADATMSDKHAKTLKALLRASFGNESWLMLSAEIQDALRERKRDALAAYLLAQPEPDAAPTGKWENTNDLYAYYLLDVEMGACQLTSRLVQASGSVQLFVQRCFMGIEPDVKVQADGAEGDSAWRWWTTMRKYRLEEANWKVFLWPENWIEPQLKKDRSSFFKDLENELLQNEVNQETVETAFANYLTSCKGWRNSRSPASTKKTTATMPSSTYSAEQPAPSHTSTTTVATTIVSGRRGKRWTSTSRATTSCRPS